MTERPSPTADTEQAAGVVVTGANAGLGLETARALAGTRRPLLLLCRDRRRGEAAAHGIRDEAAARTGMSSAPIHVVRCDLEDFASVREAAEEVRALCPRPAALVNNAGVYRARLERTAAGFERTMATNHLGHFLLTLLLEPDLRAAGSRIVQVTSKAHENGRLGRRPLDEILRGPADYRGFGAYSDSKLANVLFVRELERRWGADVIPIAVHPGVLASKIWDRNRTVAMWFVRRLTRFMRDPADAGRELAGIATAPEWDERGGAYVNRTEPVDPTLPEEPERLAAELWGRSAEAVGLAT
ncbi:MAG: SDR family NAD(P)-dependent oxidoreductase [Gemmatimonadetes bacterium]|nr:SDR family NAD(P)-dependent oxidoreductase [Gemmatimonadota bacterium]